MRSRNLISLFLAGFIIMYGCASDGVAEPASGGDAILAKELGLTRVQWIDSSSDFGRISEGQKVALSFRFRNAGTKPLVIESVRPSCGCTVADYPKEPVAPGEEGEITGEFDSNGREGIQHKEITVIANTADPEHRLHFQVTVLPKRQDATQAQ